MGTGLPTTWTKETAKWAVPLPGPSGATPAVWDDTVFVTSPDAEKNLLLFCVDRKTGKVRWQKQISIGDITKGKGNMASPSPVTDGKTVWALFGNGDLAALDFDGKILWQRHLGEEYGRFSINWIYGSSPLLFDGRLYIQVLQRSPAPPDYPGLAGGTPERESYLLALNPETGKNIFKVTRSSEAKLESQESYATPTPHIGRGRQGAVAHCRRQLRDRPRPGDGQGTVARLRAELQGWRVDAPRAERRQRRGIGHRRRSKKGGAPGLSHRGKGDVSVSGLAWKIDNRTAPDVCTAAFYNGKLFVLNGDTKTLYCLDPKTGEKKWQGPLDTRGVVFRSSPTVADGKIYMMDEKGNVFVCGTGDEFQQLAKIEMGDAEGSRAGIAVSQGQLFIRTTQALYCVGEIRRQWFIASAGMNVALRPLPEAMKKLSPLRFRRGAGAGHSEYSPVGCTRRWNVEKLSPAPRGEFRSGR